MGHENSKILIVEDDLFVATTLQCVLEDGNIEFLTAYSIKEARKILGMSAVNMIILDRILPDGDGVELLIKMRADSALKMIPVIILSGKREVLDQVYGLDQGADDYIIKPFSVVELKARVDTLLRRAQKFFTPPGKAFFHERKPSEY